MNYTENYALPQWEKSDRIMMDDFNEAMAAIDTGLKAMETAIPKIKVGTYTGNGAGSRFIQLDGTPDVLIVTYQGRIGQGNILYGGVIHPGSYPSGGSEAITLGTNGFTVKGGTADTMYRANMNGTKYHYLAIFLPK